MMLLNSLYKISEFKNENGKIESQINIDPQHEIFKGHFPQQPVLPGVCMIQIVKELIEKASDKFLFMNRADSCKFLTMADPTKTPDIFVTIDFVLNNNEISSITVLKTTEGPLLKMKSNYAIS